MTPTRVVNIRLDEFDVYCGRAGHGEKGTFGNPYTPNPGQTRNAVVNVMFREFFLFKLKHDEVFQAEVDKLCRLKKKQHGLTLGCFCAPKGGFTANDKPFICHVQVIAEYIDSHC